MVFKSFAVPFAVPFVGSFRAVDAVRPAAVVLCKAPSRLGEDWANRMTGIAVRAHLLIVPAQGSAAGLVANGAVVHGRTPQSLRRLAIRQLHRAALAAARAAVRVAVAGRPLTPTGYAILAAMAMAVALVAMFSASPAGAELESAWRLSWWFY
ncbi:hypothetical protein BN2476_930035 [Paraburkholderia piptadeniae]|uniref:Uncharacterized protein n=1 Tax=Paraburkholderia piptadeniae TaxID=1701573 RepID=A0A1N7STC5_9BURK|nr:hypothetical protein [Paraburkholderia piptadeniae]SIT50737.1 hypothetical protein BN2476_930035 [Paraburkholderia piptadeniae]